MSTSDPQTPDREPVDLVSPWLDLAVRLSLIAGLLGWSFLIVRPFLHPILWGAVLAVAVYPLFARASAALGGRPKTAAVTFVLVPLLLFTVPVVLLTETLVEDVSHLNRAYQAGELSVPPPSEGVVKIPFAGKRLFELWQGAHQDLGATVERLSPQLLQLRKAAVGFAQSFAAVLIELFFSLIVMGIFLVTARQSGEVVRGMSRRIALNHGDGLVSLARDTTRSVARGIVGVAVIQATLSAIGCAAAGVPASGLWTIAILILAIAQLPVILVLGPIAFYVFNHNSMGVAVVFAAWVVFITLIDNVLKPLLLGKGVEAPMLVVFLGAIGGMLSSGVLGLFVGPVILVVTFTLVRSWARLAPTAEHMVTPVPVATPPVAAPPVDEQPVGPKDTSPSTP